MSSSTGLGIRKSGARRVWPLLMSVALHLAAVLLFIYSPSSQYVEAGNIRQAPPRSSGLTYVSLSSSVSSDDDLRKAKPLLPVEDAAERADPGKPKNIKEAEPDADAAKVTADDRSGEPAIEKIPDPRLTPVYVDGDIPRLLRFSTDTSRAIYAAVMASATEDEGSHLISIVLNQEGFVVGCGQHAGVLAGDMGSADPESLDAILCRSLRAVEFRKLENVDRTEMRRSVLRINWAKDKGVWLIANDTTASFDANGDPVISEAGPDDAESTNAAGNEVSGNRSSSIL